MAKKLKKSGVAKAGGVAVDSASRNDDGPPGPSPAAGPSAAHEAGGADAPGPIRAPSSTPEPEGPLGWLHRIDGAVFALERGFVAAALLGITVMVFVDVAQRRLDAPDSKLGKIIGDVIGAREGDATRLLLDHTLSPIILAVVGVVLLWFGVVTYERQTGKRVLAFPGGPIVVALGIAAALAATGWAIITLPSKHVYSVMIALGMGAFIAHEVRARVGRWQIRAAFAVVGTAVALWGAQTYFTEGYTWAKEVSTFLLLWVGFLGASLCVYTGKHIRLEAGEKLIPPRARRYVAAVGRLATAGLCGFFAWLGVVYLQGSGGLGVLEQTRMPAWIVTAAIPVAFGITAIRFLGSAISGAFGGRYGEPAKDESLEAAEKAAGRSSATDADSPEEKASAGRVVLRVAPWILILLLPLAGKGGTLAAGLLLLVLLGTPLFVVIGAATILCFLLWSADVKQAEDLTVLVERMRTLADNQALLAVPMFVMSGAIMSAGQISTRLIGFARALLGWLPGGMAISAVLACMIFAAISGSSPATVVAIGGMMGPTLIREGYRDSFSLGLVTSAGSLGILIPPSLPMIVYCIVNQRDRIEVERLFAAGVGPGFLIGGALMAYCLYRGVVGKSKRDPFDLGKLWVALRDGFWSLLFPIIILGGIYLGIFNAVESAAMSVVYALVVELYLHRALKISDLPKVFHETALLLGSLLVILVVATSLGEFLEGEDVPMKAAHWVASMNLAQWQFLIVVNLLLLVVGCVMDIMSAIFIFVPLLAPMATALGVHPIHFAIVFIVNLEIGYLTPPVGLNLFVSSTLFNRPMGFMIRSVVPFILVMFVCLGVITYWPGLTEGGADLVMGEDSNAALGGGTGELGDEPHVPVAPGTDAGPGASSGRVQTLEEMMAEQEAEAERAAAAAAADAGPAEDDAAGAAVQGDAGSATNDAGSVEAADPDEEADPEPSF